MNMMQTTGRSAPGTVPAQTDTERIAALRQAVAACYCGLGPACHLWQAFTPEQRVACSLDKRAVAQAMWMNGM